MRRAKRGGAIMRERSVKGGPPSASAFGFPLVRLPAGVLDGGVATGPDATSPERGALARRLEADLRRAAPAGIAVAFGAWGADAFRETSLFADEEAAVREAAAWRRAEFAAGRVCARRALARLGSGAAPAPIPKLDDGGPSWPDGDVGAITHCRGLAGAAASAEASFGALGLDLERTDRLRARALERVAHPSETAGGGEGREAASAVFSLKEAFYKAQSPRFGASPGFRDVALACDWDGGTARVAWLDERFAEIGRIPWSFVFVRRETHVAALCFARGPV